MVMSGDRVGMFLHVKYGHKGRHAGTCVYIHTHIHTHRDPWLRCQNSSTAHLTDRDTEAERNHHIS